MVIMVKLIYSNIFFIQLYRVTFLIIFYCKHDEIINYIIISFFNTFFIVDYDEINIVLSQVIKLY